MCPLSTRSVSSSCEKMGRDLSLCVRKNLSQQKSALPELSGPEEVKKARKIVAKYSVGNAAIGAMTAQAPGFDELVLSGVEVAMATDISKNVYGFEMNKSLLSGLAAGFAGSRIGKWLFKSVSWIPGVGNAVNAGVAGVTTAAIGEGVIQACERMQKDLNRGKKIDNFIREMEK